jgi:hypothetical protein
MALPSLVRKTKRRTEGDSSLVATSSTVRRTLGILRITPRG